MSKTVSGFNVEPLEDMVAVGAVRPNGVRLWARAPGARKLVVEIRSVTALPDEPSLRAEVVPEVDAEADHTVAFDVPEDTPGIDKLAADARYTFKICRIEGEVIGEGRFRTSAEGRTTGRFTFGIASCHQPFDASGRLLAESVRMLSAVERTFDAHDIRFLLLVGDQIYADYPPSRSLFGNFFREVGPKGRETVLDCTRAEVRQLYHMRHRIWFGVEAFRRLQACFPSYPMLDDHELRDNFGSAPEHSSPRWAALRDGARDAFFDYQASRVLKKHATAESFHYSFVSGPVGVFMMDLRSERKTTAEFQQIYGSGQHAELQRFLSNNADLPCIAVVVTVPVAHIEVWLTDALMKLFGEGSDVSDRWSNPKALLDRNRLLRTIRDHMRAYPKQRVIMIGGDIHVGCLFRIDWTDGTPALHQFTSSAISNVQPRPAQVAAEGIAKTVHGIFGEDDLRADVSPVHGTGPNPYGGLNVGIVEIDCGEHTTVRFRLMGAPDEEGNAKLVYDSGPI